jgi:two-component system, NtrC family, sensor histidine kinase HydH
MERSRKIKLIAGSIAVISVVHYLYLFPVQMSVTRELVSHAYFFPIIVAALWFGLRGGVPAPVIGSLICLPYSIITMGQYRICFYDEVLQLFLFILVGSMVGILPDLSGDSCLHHSLENGNPGHPGSCGLSGSRG